MSRKRPQAYTCPRTYMKALQSMDGIPFCSCRFRPAECPGKQGNTIRSTEKKSESTGTFRLHGCGSIGRAGILSCGQ